MLTQSLTSSTTRPLLPRPFQLLQVHPDYQQKGIGSQLLSVIKGFVCQAFQEVHAFRHRRHGRHLTLWVEDIQETSRAFWKRHGVIATEDVDHDWNGPLDILVDGAPGCSTW